MSYGINAVLLVIAFLVFLWLAAGVAIFLNWAIGRFRLVSRIFEGGPGRSGAEQEKEQGAKCICYPGHHDMPGGREPSCPAP